MSNLSVMAAQGYVDAVAILTAVAQLRDSHGEESDAYKVLAEQLTGRLELACAASGLANFMLDLVAATELDRDEILAKLGRHAAAVRAEAE